MKINDLDTCCEMSGAEMKGIAGGSNLSYTDPYRVTEQTPELKDPTLSDLMNGFSGYDLPENLKSMLIKFGYKESHRGKGDLHILPDGCSNPLP